MKLSRERMLHNVSLFDNTRGPMEERKVLSYDNGQKKRSGARSQNASPFLSGN